MSVTPRSPRLLSGLLVSNCMVASFMQSGRNAVSRIAPGGGRNRKRTSVTPGPAAPGRKA